MAALLSKSLKMAWPSRPDQRPVMPGTNRLFPVDGQEIDTENPSWALLLTDKSLTLKSPASGKPETKGKSK